MFIQYQRLRGRFPASCHLRLGRDAPRFGGSPSGMTWQEALTKFGHKVSFEQVRGQIGKGGDKLLPVFLSPKEQKDHARILEDWRSQHFKTRYLPLIRPFAAVPNLLQRVRDTGLRVAVAASAKRDELEQFLEIADVTDLVDETTSSEDVGQSKPAPDVFKAVLKTNYRYGGEDARRGRRRAVLSVRHLRCRLARA